MFCSTSGLNKDSLALKEAAINREDEVATANMQQDAEVVFYWDGGDCAKNEERWCCLARKQSQSWCKKKCLYFWL
jgi:hypothetical protein